VIDAGNIQFEKGSIVTNRIEDRLKILLVTSLMLKTKPEAIGDNDDLMKTWNIDSVQIAEIVIGLEEHFGIALDDDEFKIKDFRTVKDIADLVRQKNSSA